MGKKKQVNHRAAQAHRRNVEKAELRKKAQKRKAFMDKYSKQIIIGCVAVVVAIILIWLGCKWFVGPGGSLPNFFGNLRTVESDWIVANTGTSSNPRYYKMAEFQAPEGYTLDPEYTISTDDRVQTQYYNANSTDQVAQSIYVAGVTNMTAAAQVERVMGFGYYESIAQGTLSEAGIDAEYIYCVYNESEEGTADEDKVGYATLCLYSDSVKDSCVLLMLNSAEVKLTEVATEEAMLAAASELLPNLTVVK